MSYQVGDLFHAAYMDKTQLFIITEITKEGAHVICCMRTHKVYEYNKKSVDSLFCKVA